MERGGAPVDARRARLINHLNSGAWFFPWRTWPSYLREMILLDHKRNRDRFTLFFFLTGNGLSPQIAASWALLWDVRHGKEILGNYDPSARAQIDQMMAQLEKGTFFKGDKKMMCMAENRVIEM